MSSHNAAINYIVKPVAAGLVTAGVFLVVGAPGAGIGRIAVQGAIAAVGVLVADAVTSSGSGDQSAILGPVVSAAIGVAANKLLLRSSVPMLDLAATFLIIDAGVMFTVDPIARALGYA